MIEQKYIKTNLESMNNKLLIDDKIILFLLGFYIILKPFYFWSSGLPQISDFLMILVSVLFIWTKKAYSISLENKSIVMWTIIFSFYSVGVNLVWSILLSTTAMIAPSVYLIYNSLVLIILSVMTQLYEEKLLEVIYNSALISIVIQFVLFLIQGGFLGTRNTAAFNNPNQLGYYSLLIAAIIIFCSTELQLITKTTFIGLLLGLILVFSSLSKAAILSYVGLILLYTLRNIVNRKHTKKILFSILIIVGVYLIVDFTTEFIENNYLFQSVEQRITSIGQDNDDNLEGRGYDRITNYPEYWLFGAGEGDYQRFLGPLQGAEFHSTLGNIQVSYGLIGLLSFILILHYALKRYKYRYFYIILCLLLYGLTHNGLRNSFFWVLLGVMGSIKYRGNNKITNRT